MEWALFAGLPPEDVRTVIASARRRSFARDQILFHEADPADSLHLIAKGRVAVQRTSALGKTLTLDIRCAGEFVGEMALVGSEAVRTASALAIEPTETFSVHRDAFDELRRKNPSLDGLLIRILTDRVRDLNEQLEEALYTGADVRVRRRVLRLASLYGSEGGPTEIPLGQEELAELTGTTRVTVNKVLRQEQERGTVKLSRGRITVLDEDGLRKRSRI